MLRHLARCGLEPVQCELGREKAVAMRDMGANTPAAAAWVRPDDLPCCLRCRRIDGGDATSSEGLALQLQSPAEAVLLARASRDPLPLAVAEMLWEQRACAPSRLPDFEAIIWEAEEAVAADGAAW